jgi:predicted metal-binding membrane protein
MTGSAVEGQRTRDELAPAFVAVRASRGLVALLFALAAVGWWWTVGQMRGMDTGPWTGLGTFGWFLSVWIVMMAAMMLPSVAPTVALYARMTKQRSPSAPLIFTSGYLIAWAVAGVLAFLIRSAIGWTNDAVLDWNHAGRWLAGITLVVAAAYQLTPLKDVCLGKCRSPLGFLMGAWREGRSGALVMGAKHGAWCVGCCWALMTALFALGIMSVTWMAVVAVIIALEKTLPWRRAASLTTTAILIVLAVLVLGSPSRIPGFTVPNHQPMHMSTSNMKAISTRP